MFPDFSYIFPDFPHIIIYFWPHIILASPYYYYYYYYCYYYDYYDYCDYYDYYYGEAIIIWGGRPGPKFLKYAENQGKYKEKSRKNKEKSRKKQGKSEKIEKKAAGRPQREAPAAFFSKFSNFSDFFP